MKGCLWEKNEYNTNCFFKCGRRPWLRRRWREWWWSCGKDDGLRFSLETMLTSIVHQLVLSAAINKAYKFVFRKLMFCSESSWFRSRNKGTYRPFAGCDLKVIWLRRRVQLGLVKKLMSPGPSVTQFRKY